MTENIQSGRVHALIPAAGRGKRYGGDVLKQYLPVCGKAVLAHSIRAFQFHPMIDGITVVVAADDRMFSTAVGSLADSVETVAGGDTRAESVRNGLEFIANKYPAADWVLIHDAARPCLTPESLDHLLEVGMKSDDGAILAVPVADTLKRSDENNKIVETIDRREVWAAQTPQLFRLNALIQAIDKAQQAGAELTDEASAMEFSGASPKLVLGSSANIKITHPSDLAIAEALLGHHNSRTRQ